MTQQTDPPAVPDGGRQRCPRRHAGRGTLMAVLAALATVVALTVTTQPASADDPLAVTQQRFYANAQLVNCFTPVREGVLYEWGAWGYYIDGCTAPATCPTSVYYCTVVGESNIRTWNQLGHRVTLNAKLRKFAFSGAITWQDTTCSGINSCTPSPYLSTWIYGGESASIQCNGVRQYVPGVPNSAVVSCHVYLQYYYRTT